MPDVIRCAVCDTIPCWWYAGDGSHRLVCACAFAGAASDADLAYLEANLWEGPPLEPQGHVVAIARRGELPPVEWDD